MPVLSITIGISDRARAWATSFVDAGLFDHEDGDFDKLAHFIQKVMDDERQRALTMVEKALVDQM